MHSSHKPGPAGPIRHWDSIPFHGSQAPGSMAYCSRPSASPLDIAILHWHDRLLQPNGRQSQRPRLPPPIPRCAAHCLHHHHRWRVVTRHRCSTSRANRPKWETSCPFPHRAPFNRRRTSLHHSRSPTNYTRPISGVPAPRTSPARHPSRSRIRRPAHAPWAVPSDRVAADALQAAGAGEAVDGPAGSGLGFIRVPIRGSNGLNS